MRALGSRRPNEPSKSAIPADVPLRMDQGRDELSRPMAFRIERRATSSTGIYLQRRAAQEADLASRATDWRAAAAHDAIAAATSKISRDSQARNKGGLKGTGHHCSDVSRNLAVKPNRTARASMPKSSSRTI